MATNWHLIEGTIKWAKVYEPDNYNGAERWKIVFYPKDERNKKKLKDSGISVTFNKDDDGEFVNLRRDTKKLIRDELVVFAPPKIMGKVQVSYHDQEGNEVRSVVKGDGKTITRQGDPDVIWNGSKVLVNIAVYDTAKGKGHRLESIKVLELADEPVDSEKAREPTEEDVKVKAETKVVEDTPVVSTGKGRTQLEEDMNDEIPF